MFSSLTTVNSNRPAKFYQFNCKNLFMRTLINPESDEGRVGRGEGGCDSIEGRRQRRRRRMLSEPSQLHPTCRPRLLISTISHHPAIIKDCPIPAPSLSHHLLSKYNKYLQIINCFFNGDSISPPFILCPLDQEVWQLQFLVFS